MTLLITARSTLHPGSGMQHPVPSEITPQAVYEGRRAWLKSAAALGAMASGANAALGLVGEGALAQAAVRAEP